MSIVRQMYTRRVSLRSIVGTGERLSLDAWVVGTSSVCVMFDDVCSSHRNCGVVRALYMRRSNVAYLACEERPLGKVVAARGPYAVGLVDASVCVVVSREVSKGDVEKCLERFFAKDGVGF